MAFGEVTIDVESRRVRTPGGTSDLEPRIFDLLLTLAERPGLTVSHGRLIETVWGAAERSNEALSHAVGTLRRALGDDARAPRFIETVPELGYRWIFEEAPSRARPWSRWPLGPAWVAAGAMLAVAVGGAGSVAAYAWGQGGEPDKSATRKPGPPRSADGACTIRDDGIPSDAERASSSPGCAPAEPRSFVER